MRTIAMGTFIAFALAGCGSKDSGDSGTTTETGGTTATGTTTTDPGTLEWTISWSDEDGADPSDTDGDYKNDLNCSEDTVEIEIDDPAGMTDWDFGMAEVGATGWTGEDCLNGYAGYNFCHGIGVKTTLTETCKISEIAEGTSTLLDASKDPFLTYYIADANMECFVTGNDTSYYDSLGCTVMM